MRIETERLIIRNFTLEDEADLCEYMLQRVDAEFEAYPWFSEEKSREQIEFRSGSNGGNVPVRSTSNLCRDRTGKYIILEIDGATRNGEGSTLQEERVI